MWWFGLAVSGLAMMGCTGGEGSDRFDASEVPGSDPWNADVGCSTDADCQSGETCEEGVCQMARCLEDYGSAPPLGQFRYLGVDGELIIVGDDHWVDGFEVASDGYVASIDLSNQPKILDVAGGNLNGQRPQGIAVVLEGSHEILLDQSDGTSMLDVGFAPVDVATGDIDFDGLDELVALGREGELAVCHVDEKSCGSASIEGVKGRDVTVGDVDADGYDEAVILYEKGSDEFLMVWNLDAETTGQEGSYGWSLNFDAKEIDAGDLYGKGYDVVAIKHEGGWAGQAADHVEIFDVTAEGFVASKEVHKSTIDVAIGDRDGDDKAELVTLRSDHKFELFEANEDLSLTYAGTAEITVGSSAQRLAFVDYDGDSPAGRLVDGPELIAGQAVPIAMMMFPPYPHAVAGGPLSAGVDLGQTEATDESYSDTVSLELGMSVGFGAEAFGFKAKVSTFLSNSVAVTQESTKSMRVGARYGVISNPEMWGRDYAAVVMGCGCYHRYRYETDDPAGKLDGSGKLADILVPVGGQHQLWSSRRYNALAEATGTLPVLDVPVIVGDPTSYPATPETLAGEPIADEDMVFPDTPSYQVSDVGFVGFYLAANEYETNAIAETTTVGMSAGLGAFGAEVDVDAKVGVTQGYSIRVGNEAFFHGRVPPVPDDPNTPEDEYAVHRYAFSPHVYREHWTNAAGEDSGFYVIGYTVGDAQPGL